MRSSADIASLLGIRRRREAVADERLAAARRRERALVDEAATLDRQGADLERRIHEASPLGRMRPGVQVTGAMLLDAVDATRRLAAERVALAARQAALDRDLALAREAVALRETEAREARRRALRTELLVDETSAGERRERDRAAEREEERVGDERNARRV